MKESSYSYSNYWKPRRNARKKANRCVRCGKVDANTRKGGSLCAKHQKDATEAVRKHRRKA